MLPAWFFRFISARQFVVYNASSYSPVTLSIHAVAPKQDVFAEGVRDQRACTAYMDISHAIEGQPALSHAHDAALQCHDNLRLFCWPPASRSACYERFRDWLVAWKQSELCYDVHCTGLPQNFLRNSPASLRSNVLRQLSIGSLSLPTLDLDDQERGRILTALREQGLVDQSLHQPGLLRFLS